MRLQLAIWAGKAAMSASRVFGRGGSTLPGRIALKVEPRILDRLVSQIECPILVTGTNGKTTTASLLAAILNDMGKSVIHNASGANLASGITASLVGACSGLGMLKAHFAVLEVDEATLPKIVEEVRPKITVVTNFFQDQVDRYEDPDHTAELVRRGLETLTETSTVLLNADDPLVATLGEGLRARCLYYGLDCPDIVSTGGSHDVKHCHACGGPYHYQGFYYAHLGIYRCPDCGWKRPDPSFRGVKVISSGTRGTHISLGYESLQERLFVKMPGLYNVYNVVAAGAAAWALGATLQQIKLGIEGFAGAFGRMEGLTIKGRKVLLVLAKNPVGLDEVLKTIRADRGTKSFLIAINDNTADGRDVSWLWDVGFESLVEEPVRFTMASGLRAEDVALRLKYSGIDTLKISWNRNISRAFHEALRRTRIGESLYVLSNYTAMLELRGQLAKSGLVRRW